MPNTTFFNTEGFGTKLGMELNQPWEMRVEFGKFRSKSWDIANFPLVTLGVADAVV